MLINFSYKPVPDCENKAEDESAENNPQKVGSRRWSCWTAFTITLTIFTIVLYTTGGILFNFWSLQAKYSQSLCPNPIIRREWRSLRDSEKVEYLSAVDCLYNTPSIIRPNTTIYEDFSWSHNLHSDLTHHTASFLPWHRYFLQVYLENLRTHCGYTGDLVYWDWTLDFEDPSASPVFDLHQGFGGDGAFDDQVNMSNGTCVSAGPFSHYRGLYVNSKYAPHCLSRKFGEKFFMADASQSPYRPEVVQKLLSASSFDNFTSGIYQIHDDLHDGIGGDLQHNTSPYDPLFFVHHTQLDRLWWLWQQQDESRALDYGGDNGEHADVRNASLSDQIVFEPLAGTFLVSSVMHTETELLCYRY